MSSDYDIEMSLNDTLELDTIIQEWSTPIKCSSRIRSG